MATQRRGGGRPGAGGRPVVRQASANAHLPPDLPPAGVIAPRAMAAAMLTTVVAAGIGAGVVAGWLEATDPAHVRAVTNAGDLLRAIGAGLLAGLVAGIATSLLAGWGAMLLRRRLYSGRGSARLIGLAATVVLWAVAVQFLLHVIGFGGLGALGFVVALPALAVALALTWVLVPWVTRVPDESPVSHRRR